MRTYWNKIWQNENIFDIKEVNAQIDVLTKENSGLRIKLNEITEKYEKLWWKILIDDDQIIKQLNKANFIIKDKQSLLKTLIIYDFRQNEKNKTYNGNRYCQKTYKFCHPLNSISKKLLWNIKKCFKPTVSKIYY